jgi:hypothetical protein
VAGQVHPEGGNPGAVVRRDNNFFSLEKRQQFCFLGEITIRSNNDSYLAIAMTRRSDNDFNEPRAINKRIDNVSPQC